MAKAILKEPRSFGVRISAYFLALLIGFLAVFSVAAPAQADEELEKVSFYALSSSLSSFFSDSLSPDREVEGEDDAGRFPGEWQTILSNPGSAGSLLGYADKDRDDGSGWLNTSFSVGTVTINYKAFSGLDYLSGIKGYVYYGAALNSLGLDNASSNWLYGMVGMIGGNIMGWAADLAAGVNNLFAIAIKFLQWINPFGLLYQGFNQVVSSNFTEAMISGDTSNVHNPFAQGLANFMSTWIVPLFNLSWAVIIPMFIAMTILMLLFGGRSGPSKTSRLKTLFIRVFFVAAGIPIVGGLYTSTLTQLDNVLEDNAGVTYQAVLETYLDFESWVFYQALTPPGGSSISWDSSRNTAELSSHRDFTLEVNKVSNPYIKTLDFGGGSADLVVGAKPAAKDILSRYNSGDTIDASDYETRVKGALSNQIDRGNLTNEEVVSWFKELQGKPSKVANADAEFVTGNPLIYTNNPLTMSVDGDIYTFSGGGGVCLDSDGNSAGLTAMTCTFAPLGMYNYLNTSFSPEKLRTYGAEKTFSLTSREAHSSVVLVGDTLPAKVSSWFLTVVTLGSIVLIGFSYVVSMFTTGVKRTIQLISGVPFALLGALSGIARVIIYTVTFLIEIIGTMFMYVLVQKLLFSVLKIPAAIINSFNSWAAGAVGLLFNFVMSLIIIGFTFKAIQMRKQILGAIEEKVSDLINKFVEPKQGVGAPGSGGGMGGKVGQMAGGAAGLAALGAMGGGMGGLSAGLGDETGGDAGVIESGDGSDGGGEGTGDGGSSAGGGSSSGGGFSGDGGGGAEPLEGSSADSAGQSVAASGLSEVGDGSAGGIDAGGDGIDGSGSSAGGDSDGGSGTPEVIPSAGGSDGSVGPASIDSSSGEGSTPEGKAGLSTAVGAAATAATGSPEAGIAASSAVKPAVASGDSNVPSVGGGNVSSSTANTAAAQSGAGTGPSSGGIPTRPQPTRGQRVAKGAQIAAVGYVGAKAIKSGDPASIMMAGSAINALQSKNLKPINSQKDRRTAGKNIKKVNKRNQSIRPHND